MSEKKRKIVQPVKENTPTEQTFYSETVSETARDANNGKDIGQEKTVVQKPLTISERMNLIEQQLSQADKNFQQIGVFIEKMAPLIELSNRVSQQQQAPVPTTPQGNTDVMSLLNSPMIKELLGSGGGQNSVLEEYGRQYMDLSGFVVKEVFKNIVPEAVTRMEAAAAARIAAKAPV